MQQEDYDYCYKLAFKAGTDIVLHQRYEKENDFISELFGSVQSLVLHLNAKYNLNGKRKLSVPTLLY